MPLWDDQHVHSSFPLSWWKSAPKADTSSGIPAGAFEKCADCIFGKIGKSAIHDTCVHQAARQVQQTGDNHVVDRAHAIRNLVPGPEAKCGFGYLKGLFQEGKNDWLDRTLKDRSKCKSLCEPYLDKVEVLPKKASSIGSLGISGLVLVKRVRNRDDHELAKFI
jgi:hypothetical protein